MSAVPTLLQVAACLFCAASLLVLGLTTVLALLAPVLQARRPRQTAQPPVSVVVPVKALDFGFEAAQQSIFAQDYPQFDVTITAVAVDSPAVAAARAILAAHREISTQVVQSTAQFAASPKVNNLYRAIEDARCDLILVKDSNISLPTDGLAEAVGAMTPGVGLVTGVPEARDALNFSAQIEGQIMNQSHGRLLLAASALGIGFGVGKMMAFRRSDLHRAGGFDAIAHSVGEDAALSHALATQGLRTVFMRKPIVQRLGARRFRDMLHRQIRWTVVRRNDEIGAYLAEPFGLATCAALAGALAAPLWAGSPLWTALAILALWFAMESALAFARGWDVSIAAPAVMVARDSMMLYIWLRAWFSRSVVWAAEVYDARLDDGRKPASDDGRKPISDDGRRPASDDGRKPISDDGRKSTPASAEASAKKRTDS